MRANTAEFERENTGDLLVPMLHVEHDIARGTVIVSYELPLGDLYRIEDRSVCERKLNEWAERVTGAFLAEWDKQHSR